MLELQLAGRGKKENIRGRDAVYRRNKRDSDSFSHAVDVVQVLHHLNQAEDSADDSDSR